MFSFSDLEPQHILTGAQVRTNVAGMNETKEEKKEKKTETNEKPKKEKGMDTGATRGRGGLRKEGLSTGS